MRVVCTSPLLMESLLERIDAIVDEFETLEQSHEGLTPEMVTLLVGLRQAVDAALDLLLTSSS